MPGSWSATAGALGATADGSADVAAADDGAADDGADASLGALGEDEQPASASTAPTARKVRLAVMGTPSSP
jgi:hypothetical protein